MTDKILANSFMIAARARNGVIGNQGRIPWHAPHDLARFKRLTMGTAMIMGRKTWDSLPSRLPGRFAIVVTSRPLENGKAMAAGSVDQAVNAALGLPIHAIAFIGGARIYQAASELEWLGKAYITEVDTEPAGDAYFPELGSDWELKSSEESMPGQMPSCRYSLYERNWTPS